MAQRTPEELGIAWQTAMRTGDFAAAWEVSDAVMAARDPAGRDDPTVPYYRRFVWDGRLFDDRAVLVRCYHGLGDTLQFCRFLPTLRRRVAALTLETQPALIPLLELAFETGSGPDRILPFDPAAPAPSADCDLEIMELAHALRAPPDPAPYLPIERRRGTGLTKIGLCCQLTTDWQPGRSVQPELLAPLAAIPGMRIYNLQRGPAPFPGVQGPCPNAITETARLIAGLDLVVTVDTMVAHLAGSIGVPMALLLEAAPDWRWWAGGRGSVWYRGVRKYLQSVPGDWSSPVAALLADLTAAAAVGTVRDRWGS